MAFNFQRFWAFTNCSKHLKTRNKTRNTKQGNKYGKENKPRL